jgi:hypothetical protein
MLSFEEAVKRADAMTVRLLGIEPEPVRRRRVEDEELEFWVTCEFCGHDERGVMTIDPDTRIAESTLDETPWCPKCGRPRPDAVEEGAIAADTRFGEPPEPKTPAKARTLFERTFRILAGVIRGFRGAERLHIGGACEARNVVYFHRLLYPGVCVSLERIGERVYVYAMFYDRPGDQWRDRRKADLDILPSWSDAEIRGRLKEMIVPAANDAAGAVNAGRAADPKALHQEVRDDAVSVAVGQQPSPSSAA